MSNTDTTEIITGYKVFFSNSIASYCGRDGIYKICFNNFCDADGVCDAEGICEVGKVYERTSYENPFEFWGGSLFDMLSLNVCKADVSQWNIFGETGKNKICFAKVSSDRIDTYNHLPHMMRTRKMRIDGIFSFEELVQIAIKSSGRDIDQDILQDCANTVLCSSQDDIELSSSRAEILAACGRRAKLTAYKVPYTKILAVGGYSNVTAYGHNATLFAVSNSTLTSYGDFSRIVARGSDNEITAKGHYSLINTDYRSRVTVTGDNCKCEARDASTINISGKFGKFKGVEGAKIQIADFNSAHEWQSIMFAKIGENNVKPDTLYTTQDGKFVEVEAEEAEIE